MAGIESLGALASAVQLADICLRATKSLYTFLSIVIDAPDSISRHKAHFSQLIDILQLIQHCPSLQTANVQSILKGVDVELVTLQDMLVKSTAEASVGKARIFWKSLGFALKERKILSHCVRLEQQKCTLTLCIAVVDSTSFHSLNLELVKIRDKADGLVNYLPAINDTARGITSILEEMSELKRHVGDQRQGIPNILSKVTNIRHDMPSLARKIDSICEGIPVLQKTVERLELQHQVSPFLDNVEQATLDSQHQQCSRTVEETKRSILRPNERALVEPVFNNLPDSRISNFIGRKDLLELMNLAFSTCESAVNVAVLTGMGGSGKTQLAMNYCQFRSMQADSVFWANASNEESLRQSFGVIAEIISTGLRATVLRDLDSRIRYVKEALCNSLKHWFLVFDNYDVPSQFENIRHFIPHAKHGAIIVTSRHPDSVRLGCNIKVNGMHDAEALDLLLKRTNLEPTEANIKHGGLIVHRLGHLPLAIDQAGSYIRKQKVPLCDFIDHYNQKRERVLQYTPQLWEYKKRLGDEERESRLSVFTTWDLSFRQLISDHKLKELELITLFGFFHCASISEELFQAYHESFESLQVAASSEDKLLPQILNRHPTERPKWLKILNEGEENWNPFMLREKVAELHEMLLVQDFGSQNNHCKFSLHPLVSDWIKLREKDHGVRRNYTKEAIYVMASFIESRFFSQASLQTKQEVLAHLDECLANDERFLNCDDRLGCGSLWYPAASFARFYHVQGRYSSAEKLYTCVLRESKEILGCDHPETLKIVSGLGKAYHCQGWHSKAETLYSRALAGRETNVGPDNLDTALIMEDLGNIYRSNGQYSHAETLYERTLLSREVKLGPEHADTLGTIANLANNYRSQGRYTEAKELYSRALSGRERWLGRDHPDTLETVDDLANNYQSQGLYAEAEELYNRALLGRETYLGPNHPDTLWTVDNLANNYRTQTRYVDAEMLYRRALLVNETQLGLDHPETLWTIDGLATVCYNQGRQNEAEILYKKALAGRESRLGPDHHNTLRTLSGLANVYHRVCRYVDAEKLYNRVLAGQETKLGSDHPKTLTTMANLARNFFVQGKHTEAEGLYNRALAGRRVRLRPEHPETLETLDALANVYRSQGRHSDAVLLAEERNRFFATSPQSRIPQHALYNRDKTGIILTEGPAGSTQRNTP